MQFSSIYFLDISILPFDRRYCMLSLNKSIVYIIYRLYWIYMQFGDALLVEKIVKAPHSTLKRYTSIFLMIRSFACDQSPNKIYAWNDCLVGKWIWFKKKYMQRQAQRWKLYAKLFTFKWRAMHDIINMQFADMMKYTSS